VSEAIARVDRSPETLVELLRLRAEREAGYVPLRFVDAAGEEIETRDHRMLDREARAIACALAEFAVEGRPVLLLHPPGLAFVSAFLGCVYAGAIGTPLAPPLAAPEGDAERLRALVRRAEPACVLTSRALAGPLEALRLSLPELRDLPWLISDAVDSSCADSWRPPHVGPHAAALLQFTSGSTGTPRGVVVTHANLLANQRAARKLVGMSESSRMVSWLPHFHDMGLIGGILNPLIIGHPTVLLSPLDFIRRPLSWLTAVSRHRATISPAPNFAYELCVRRAREGLAGAELDLSSWETAVCGSEPIRAETAERFVETFAPYGFRPDAFLPCYGLAENTLIVSGGPTRPVRIERCDAAALERGEVRIGESGRVRRLVSCGRPARAENVVVVDPDSRRALSPGLVGELWLRGDSVASGYWREPRETLESFGAHLADGEGPFLRTGDLGFLDGGDVFVAGRKKELLVIRGRNHLPHDIEQTVERSHAAFRPGRGAAFTVYEDGDERLVVVHEVEMARVGTKSELEAAARREVLHAHGLRLHRLVCIAPRALPRTSSGKTRRREARELVLAGGLLELRDARALRATGVTGTAPEWHPTTAE
jgi:acyl-CoA synthetase (AMP-forming)/AMP-acid ligase II